MIASSQNGTNVPQFLMRQSINDHGPSHSELVSNEYGNAEFPSKILEAGSKEGLAVTEPSKQEAHLINEGQQALEHSEEQKYDGVPGWRRLNYY
jgi:hypothetical protein